MLSREAVMALHSASASGASPASAVSRSQSLEETVDTCAEGQHCVLSAKFRAYSNSGLPLAPLKTQPETAFSLRTPHEPSKNVPFETTPILEAAASRPALGSRVPAGMDSLAGFQQPPPASEGDHPQGHTADVVMTLKTPRGPPQSLGFFSPLFSPRRAGKDDLAAASKQCELHIGNDPNVVMKLAVTKPSATPRSLSSSTPSFQDKTPTAFLPPDQQANDSEFPTSFATSRSQDSLFTNLARLFGRERPAHSTTADATPPRYPAQQKISVSLTGEDSPRVHIELSTPRKRVTQAVALDHSPPLPQQSLTAVRSHARVDNPFSQLQKDSSSSTSQELHQAEAGVEGMACRIDVPRFVEVVIEVPKGSFVKHKPDGSVDYMMFLPCPFNYGSVPAFDALDGDPQDALVLGPKIARGQTTSIRVEAMLKFTDAGMVDHKLVCTQQRPPAADVPAPERHRDSAGGAAAFGLLLSGFWLKRGSPSNPLLFGHDGMSMCTASCPGRCDTGIALPVAKARASLKCALCGGAKPFPRTGLALSCAHRAALPGSEPEALPKGTVRPTTRSSASKAPGELVQLNLSLPQFILVTGFFRFFATCKNVLNTLRGRKGPTRFAGWEVARLAEAS